MTLDYNQHTLKGNYYKTQTPGVGLYYFLIILFYFDSKENKAVCADPKSVYSTVS